MEYRAPNHLNRKDRGPYEYPSFSSTLLEAIYRSTDETAAQDQNIFKTNATYTMVRQSSTKSDTGSLTGRYVQQPRGLKSSSSNSSESSSACGISSSETNSIYGNGSRSSKSFSSRKKPESKGKTGIFVKRVKQPLSPGIRLAAFLNSLFTAKNAKDKATSASYSQRKEKPESSSSSCALAKTHSMREAKELNKSTNILKARDLLKSIQMKTKGEREVDDDDDVSCASSDLFELKLSSTEIDNRFMEELPVYETTDVLGSLAIRHTSDTFLGDAII